MTIQKSIASSIKSDMSTLYESTKFISEISNSVFVVISIAAVGVGLSFGIATFFGFSDCALIAFMLGLPQISFALLSIIYFYALSNDDISGISSETNFLIAIVTALLLLTAYVFTKTIYDKEKEIENKHREENVKLEEYLMKEKEALENKVQELKDKVKILHELSAKIKEHFQEMKEKENKQQE